MMKSKKYSKRFDGCANLEKSLAASRETPGHVSLIDADLEMADKYRGMLRMSFPLASVREKRALHGKIPQPWIRSLLKQKELRPTFFRYSVQSGL
jgi:hypothetical protein